MNDHERDRDAASVPTLLADRYRIVSPLGSGGMADVYLAEDERLGRLVAVKVLKARLAADDEFLERFRIEARAAASLNHPSIVGVYDRGTADGTTYIAMEYVQRRVAQAAAAPRRRAPSGRGGDHRARRALGACAPRTRATIVHRDVTSYNVMLDEGGRVVVTDFGIARMGDSALTRTGAMMGTSSYLSPEQAQGRQADERSDLYSLGVVLYEMLTGRVPFRGETDVAVAMQHVSTAPPNPRTLEPGVSEALAGVAMRALSKNPDDRYQTADEFAAALRKARRPGRAVAGDGVKAAGAVASVGAAGAAVAAGAAGAGVGRGAAPAPAGAAPARRARRRRPPVAADRRLPRRAGAAARPSPSRRCWSRTRRRATARASRRPPCARAAGAAGAPSCWPSSWSALAAVAAWAAYTYLFAPGATVPKVVGLSGAPTRRSAIARRGSSARPALRLGRQVRRGRSCAPVSARRRVRGRRGQGRPLGEPRAAAHPVTRPHRPRRERRPEPAAGGVAQLQEPPGRVGDGAQGPDLQADARPPGRRCSAATP